MKDHYHLILNPAAGKGRALNKLSTLADFFKEKGVTYTVHKTEKPGHAAQLAASLAEKEHHQECAIVAAGGDGTCNEVVNGLMTFKNIGNDSPLPAFGVLPIGRGNDFAFGAGIPLNLKDSLENLIQDKTILLDIGWVRGGEASEGRYFANGVGLGFDAIVNAEAAKVKWFQGYIYAALKTIITYPEAPEVDLFYDDQMIQSQAALISFMNGKRLGGAFLMAPKGNMTDGLLDLHTTQQNTRRIMISALADYYKGTQDIREDTFTSLGRKFRVVARKGALVIHADGETLSTEAKDVDVHCLPGALELIKG
ncbi:YegS/Rv2252/BmrU family lipid kinase [Oceanispirochaeta crateris]|uniref:YegS/Rv2252/BmrU family lipid kinase n=1 Tax=Oceanispirochaeta crateris TaxID=2518645 RepID=A0A5C1QP89_9SPIO|nr:YegS/Rv2252/BmrU family lipid kinase [Oceanispirochaeta crateris]